MAQGGAQRYPSYRIWESLTLYRAIACEFYTCVQYAGYYPYKMLRTYQGLEQLAVALIHFEKIGTGVLLMAVVDGINRDVGLNRRRCCNRKFK